MILNIFLTLITIALLSIYRLLNLKQFVYILGSFYSSICQLKKMFCIQALKIIHHLPKWKHIYLILAAALLNTIPSIKIIIQFLIAVSVHSLLQIWCIFSKNLFKNIDKKFRLPYQNWNQIIKLHFQLSTRIKITSVGVYGISIFVFLVKLVLENVILHYNVI